MSGAAIVSLYRSVLLRGWPAALLFALMMSLLIDRLMLQLPEALSLEALEQLQAFLVSATLWRSLLALGLLSLWPSCALVLCAHHLAGGTTAPAAGGLLAALRAYPAALLIALLFSLVVSAGLALLLVPGCYLAGALQWWVVALMVGDAKASQCLQHSWRRVSGHWWRSNTKAFIVTICGLGAGTLVSALAGIAAHLLTAALLLDVGSRHIVALAISVLANFVAAPAYPVALVVSYRDLEAAGQADRPG
jgi:hypothetical protein